MEVIKVFISSSFHEDFSLGFQRERDVLKTLMSTKKNLIDISLDYGDPQIKGTIEKSLSRVEEADLIILFIGTRYGGIVEGENISLTHLEYRKAIELDKPILIYLFPTNPEHPEYGKTAEFINEIENNNKHIYADVKNLLSDKYKNMIPAYKAGYAPISKMIEKELDSYAHGLALQIVTKINEEFHNIQAKLPFGVEEIREDKEEKLKYKQYLSNETLPYISRKEFKTNCNISSDFETEETLYSDVFGEEYDYDGILITGEGGVGKTRLMFELGRKAQQDGWKVYQIFKDFKGWETLKLDKHKKYCLLFDYVEENAYFNEDIFEVLSREYHGVQIKIVANARNAFLQNNDFDYPSLKQIDLSDSCLQERQYTQYVIEKIFESKNIPFDKNAFYNMVTKPSFAVFLLQGLLKYDGKEFDFHKINEFSHYITRRLVLTLRPKDGKFLSIQEELFRFFFAMPLKSLDEIENDIRLLEEDGWIEDSEENDVYKSAYNDTIFDEILIKYIGKPTFQKDKYLKKEIKNIFDFSVKHGVFNNTFRSFERIFPKSILEKKRGLFYEVLNAYKYEISQNINLFMKAGILLDIDKLKILKEIDNIDYSSRELIKLLRRLIRNDKRTDEEKELILSIYTKWISFEKNIKKFSNHFDGSFLIPIYYEFQQIVGLDMDIDITQITLDWLDKFNRTDNADYVMKAYLKYDSNSKDITQKIEKWINKYGVEKASFLLETYFSNPSSVLSDNLKQQIEGYINESKNWDNEQYTFIVEHYLKYLKKVDLVEYSLQLWISQNKESTTENFSHIVVPYLQYGGYVKPIESAIATWLSINKDKIKSCNFIMQNFILNCNLITPIEPYIVDWLNHNQGLKKEYAYLLQRYLEYNGSLEKIELALIDYLNEISSDSNLFAIAAQLYEKYGGDLQAIDSAIKKWLSCNIQHSSFPYILSYYKEQNKAFCQKILIQWIIYAMDVVNIETDTIRRMIKDYYDDFDIYKDSEVLDIFAPLEKYLLSYTLTKEATNLDKYFLLATKYLKIEPISDRFVNKGIKEIEYLEDYRDIPYCIKYYQKLVDLKCGTTSIKEKLQKYPLLRGYYFKDYLETYKLYNVHDIYHEYLQEFNQETAITGSKLNRYSYIIRYLKEGIYDDRIDNLILNIIDKNIEKKNPIRTYLIQYATTNERFDKVKPLMDKYIEYGGKEYLEALSNIINDDTPSFVSNYLKRLL